MTCVRLWASDGSENQVKIAIPSFMLGISPQLHKTREIATTVKFSCSSHSQMLVERLSPKWQLKSRWVWESGPNSLFSHSQMLAEIWHCHLNHMWTSDGSENQIEIAIPKNVSWNIRWSPISWVTYNMGLRIRSKLPFPNVSWDTVT